MATLEEIAAALQKADAAGNVEDAQALAGAYRQMQAQQSPTPQAQAPQADQGKWAPPGVLAPIQYQLGEDGKPVGARLAVPQVISDAWNAIQAPGRAVRGEYDQREISADGEVSPFDPRMISDASSLAGLISPTSPASRIGGGLGAMAPNKMSNAMPEIDDLSAAKNAAYQTVDKLGARYSADAVDSLYGDMIRRAAQDNISPTRHPKAYSMLVDLQDRNQPMSLTQLDHLRQEIRRDLVGGDKSEAHFGKAYIDAIDNFIENAGPGQISGTSGQTANFAITTARKANTVLRKSEMLQDAMENARLRAASSGSGGNIDNSIRQELRKIVTNPKKAMSFTKDELAMMENIITGGGKLQDTLRTIGKLSPTGNGLMAALGIGATASNPLLAAVPALGMAAKNVADRSTQGAAENLTRVVRTGGPATPLPRVPGGFIPRANTTLIEQQTARPRPAMEILTDGKVRLNT